MGLDGARLTGMVRGMDAIPDLFFVVAIVVGLAAFLMPLVVLAIYGRLKALEKVAKEMHEALVAMNYRASQEARRQQAQSERGY